MFAFEFKLTLDCLLALKALAQRNAVTLMWIREYETADCLPKRSRESLFAGPEPLCKLAKGHIRNHQQ